MSRSGYLDDCDNWQMIMWRGRVASSIRGKRGQTLLKDLAEALDAMPEKKLIKHELKCSDGVCALGAVGEKRKMDLHNIDPEDYERVAMEFNIAEPLAREIMYLNDEGIGYYCSPEERWKRMRAWVKDQIK